MEIHKEWHQSIKIHKFVCSEDIREDGNELSGIIYDHWYDKNRFNPFSTCGTGLFYMTKIFRIIYIIFLLLGLESQLAFAQTSFSSEEDLKKQAQKLFSEEEFEQAFPLYTQLVSLYPKDPNLNYRLGVCMLFTSDDKERPIPFLEFASRSKDVDKEALYYLGKAYHLNYRFDEAIASYFAYKKVASASNALRLMVDRQIEMCKNGKQLLRNLSDLVVMEKKEMSREDFFRSYNISGLGGKLLVKPDEKEFKTALDKKKKDNSIIYLASSNNQIYFSSYGSDGKHGKDIFLVKKLPNGEWSSPQTLGSPVNTNYDDDFPFLHPNGKVLYFCSKGHNSMGGYDIFKSTLNEETNTWNAPVNLDFPINTPDDDILYVTDENEKEAYFSSARTSKSGSISVYHINVERKPIDYAIIKGIVVKNRDNQKLDAKITVKDLADNTIVGIYNANPETGIYVINLPSSGRFLYTVESTGFSTQSEMVTLPVQSEFRPMKQEISYELQSDKLQLKNSFDQVIDDSNYLLAMQYIKEKSKMDVTPVENIANDTSSKEIDTTSEIVSNQNTIAAKTNTSLSNDDIVKIAYNDAKDVEAEAKDLKEQADIALNFANQKNEQAQDKTKEATALMEDAAKTDDNLKKQSLTESANEASKEAEQLNQETVTAFNLAKKLDIVANAKQEEADLSQKYAEDLEAAVKSKNATDALAKLDAQEKKLEELSQKNSAASSISGSLKMDLDNKQKELDKAIQASADFKSEIADNETVITNLSTDLDNTKNEDLKKGLSNQIEELNKDIEVKQKQFDQNELVVAKLQKELAGIKNENDLVNSVIDQSKIGTSEAAAANVASIDKTKLEEQVNSIKNSSADTNDLAANTNNQQPITNNEKSTTNIEQPLTSNKSVIFDTDYTRYENDLADAEKISDEMEREKTKADVFLKWSEAIKADVQKQKQALSAASNNQDEAAFAEQIKKSEQLSNEKQTLADMSLTKIETLKQKQTLAANNQQPTTTNEQPTTNNEQPLANNQQPTTTNNQQPTTNNIVFQKYENNIVEADKIEDATQREKTKADLYLMWSQAIDADIIKQKQELASTTDPEQKALIAKKIEEEEKLSGEKQTQSDVSLAKLESIEQQQKLDAKKATNVSPDTSNQQLIASHQLPATNNEQPVVTPNYQKFTDDLIAADKIADEKEREKNKAELLKKWSEAIDADVQKQKQQFIATNDPEKKKLLSASISEGNNLLKEKQLLANISNTKLDSLNKTSALVAATTANDTNINPDTTANTNPNINTNINTNTITITDTVALANTTIKNTIDTNSVAVVKTVGSNVNENKTPYNSASIAEQVEKANLINKEAEELITKSVELKSQAATETNEESKNALYAQSEDLIKQSNDKKTQASQLISSANQNQFLENQIQLNKYNIMFEKNDADDISIAEMMNDESKIYFNKAHALRAQADSLKSDDEKETTIAEANQNELIALGKQKTGIEIYKKYDTASVAPVAMVNSNVNAVNPNNIQPAANTTQPTVNTIQPSAVALEANEKFERNPVPVYSVKKPIPVNEKLPEGLIFKVQIGAFKNPIPQDLFQGMSPITGETTPQGFIRYTAGLFVKFATADKVKKEIRDMGYKDAFVVAFLNGKRISMNEALAMAGINPAELANTNNQTVTATNAQNTIVANNNQPSFNNQQPTTSNQTPTTNNQTPTANSQQPTTNNQQPNTNNQQPNINNQQPAIARTENIAEVNGLFYTVQVGVFSQPVTSEKLFNVQPLYTETAPNGNLRYNTGIYNSVQHATEAKDVIVGKGLKDAYITAYYKGKRISLSEAKQLEEQGNDVFSKQSNMNAMPNFGAAANQPPVVNTTVPYATANTPQPPINANQQLNAIINQNNTQTVESGVVFKVQIGAFTNEVPLQMVNKFLSISAEGIKNYKDEKGLTIYTIGNFKTYNEATAVKTKVIATGITDAFIVAYHDGKKISLDEAKTLLNK